MSVGQKIKRVRELKNLTQDHIADKLGMSVQGYGKIERDETDIPYSRLEQIASVFNMKVEDLVSFDDRFILNVMNNQIGIKDFNYTNPKLSEKERELYEKNIKLLEEKIKWLESKLTEK